MDQGERQLTTMGRFKCWLQWIWAWGSSFHATTLVHGWVLPCLGRPSNRPEIGHLSPANRKGLATATCSSISTCPDSWRIFSVLSSDSFSSLSAGGSIRFAENRPPTSEFTLYRVQVWSVARPVSTCERLEQRKTHPTKKTRKLSALRTCTTFHGAENNQGLTVLLPAPLSTHHPPQGGQVTKISSSMVSTGLQMYHLQRSRWPWHVALPVGLHW